MFADNSSQPPSSVRETIDWLLRLGRPPLPECPIEAAKAGKEPKAPCFLDAKYLKSVNWKQWQNTQPLPEILDAWFSNPKTGIGTLGGWNGKHWLGWIDIDRKNYVSADECDRAIEVWLEQYPVMAASPRFRTPSGGYRLLVAFSREPENFKASSGFSLQPDGGQKVGELLSKSGGHTLLPPTVGVSGQPYRWERWSEYPPIVEQPENVGLYPVQKHQARKQDTPTADKIKPADTTISDFLNTQVYPILSAEVAYNWPDHDWKPDGDKLRGNCPWHESSSGTAFYVDPKDGTYAWRCSACEISGYPVHYRYRLAGGDGTPRGKDFVDIVRQLAADVGVEMPEFKPRDPTFKVVEHPTANRQITIPEEELDRRIDDLSNQDLQPSKLTAKLNLLAKEAGLPSSEVKRIYHERLQEQELAESRPERAAEIEELLKVGTHTLKLAEELPAMYAQPLMLLAQYLNLREEVYLLALLSGLSICHRTGTELIIHRGQGFSVPLNLFAGIVSESGQRKSPVIKAIITNPLRVLQREAKAEHKTAIAKYEADLERWNEIKGEEREAEFPDGKPQAPPQQKIYFFTSTSGSESINRQVAAHPDQPLLYLKDELIGVFTQQGKYSQGRGSEKQDFLSYYDGTGSTELLADGVRSDTEIILMSIFGSVQPEVLRKFTNDCTDPDGQWARFLWVVQSLAAATLQDDAGGNVDITDLLAGLYRRVSLLPGIEYTLSRDAFKLYQKVYNRIEQLRVNCPDPGMRAVYSKMTGQLGRLVGNCHVIHELASGQDVPNQEIPLVRMKQGVRMITFFLEQVKIIRSDSAAAQGELPDIFKKIIQLSQRLGRIKAKQVQKNYDSIKLTPDQIREAFLELKAMGYGTTYGTGNKLEWEYQPRQIDANESSRQSVGETVGKTVGAVGETVGAAPTTVTTSTQGFQETVGEIGAVGDFSQKTSQQEFIQECYSTSAGEAPNFSGFSPTAPTAPTVLSNQDWGSIPAVGVAPTVSPTAPTVFQKESVEGKVTLQIGDTVRLPDGQEGIVDVVYPDGLLGVEYGNGTKFAKWEPSALTVVTPDGDDDDPHPSGGAAKPDDPVPQDGDGGAAKPDETNATAVEDAIAVDPEALTGQYCNLEDAPESVLTGQAVDLWQVANSQHRFKYLDKISPQDGDGGTEVAADEYNPTSVASAPTQEVASYNPRSAVIHKTGKVEVDLEKIDLSYTPAIAVPEWKPSKTLPAYESLSKLYLDLETSGLDPHSDRVLMAGVMDDAGQKYIFTDADETQILTRLFAFLKANKPNLLIGYNIFGFDLNFLITRCQSHKRPCCFHQANKPKRISASSVHGQPIEFTPVFWRDTSILDGYHQVGVTDKGRAIFSGYSLKDAVLTLKLRDERRLELSHSQIQECWATGNLATIQEYLEFDLDDTKLLADFLFPGVYYQAQIVPDMTIQQLSYDSPAAKWERIYESLYPGKVLPKADVKVDYPGATCSCNPGLYKDCAKVDVNSLYPSLQVKYHLTSRKDNEHKAVGVTKYLLDHRLELKQQAKTTGDKQAEHQAHALKIIANSGTGFCGVGGYPYNDMEAAALVTAYGAKVLILMMEIVEGSGGTLIECDTDGIIFNGIEPQLIRDRINQALPDGISVSLDWANTDVYVPKLKNYLLFTPSGKVKAVGGFRKRDKSRLQKEFPVEFLKLYLQSPEDASIYYQSVREMIASGTCGVDWFIMRQKIRKGDRALTGAGLGVEGDIVNYYYTKQEQWSEKTGKPLKPCKFATTSGLYWVEYYVAELDKIHTELMAVILGKQSEGN